MKNKIILYSVFTLICLFPISAFAQERVQITGGYAVSEINKNILNEIENKRTLSINGKVNLLNQDSGWTFGPVFNFQQSYNEEVFEESPIYPDGIYRDVKTYYGGFELAKKAKSFRFGGGFFLGTRQPHETLDRVLVRKYRGFVDIKAKYLVFRPFFAEIEASGGFNNNKRNRYGAELGVVF